MVLEISRFAFSYALGFLIALPQIIPAARYLPKSIRHRQTAQDKQAIGSIPPLRLLKGMLIACPKDLVDGVFYPEACATVGILGFIFALFSPSWHQWTLLAIAGVLAIGRHSIVFHWCSPLMLRIPARMVYFVNLALVFMAVSGLQVIYAYYDMNNLLVILILLQCFDLCTNSSSLWPMRPFTQRWEKPSRSLNTPLVSFLKQNLGPYRVSGLPFPLATGQLHGFRTLGYNGGSAMKAMARFRKTENPMGDSGNNLSQSSLNWYGVKYAYTYRHLTGAWVSTKIPHLYENTEVASHVPSWNDLEDKYGKP